MSKTTQAIVEIKINNQSYKISCENGEQEHIQNLSQIINKEVEGLVASLGQIGDTRLLLMASLIIADRVYSKQNYNNKIDNNEYESFLEIIKKATKRIESVADKLV
tara:strand:+ start:412 stop:729 length:318 start_codon:yes stop_codon:yes gene_type:complete